VYSVCMSPFCQVLDIATHLGNCATIYCGHLGNSAIIMGLNMVVSRLLLYISANLGSWLLLDIAALITW